MYGCLSGIILVNAACTRSWLAIAPSTTVVRMNRINSGLRLWKIQYEIRPTQSAENCACLISSSGAAVFPVSFVMIVPLPRRSRRFVGEPCGIEQRDPGLPDQDDLLSILGNACKTAPRG